ncbi:MAG: hypothetical protein KDA80_23055 [Planctomycetaceae bacterium]|nr:hypothetical protein [Planctomycetaceae bacterium]
MNLEAPAKTSNIPIGNFRGFRQSGTSFLHKKTELSQDRNAFCEISLPTHSCSQTGMNAMLWFPPMMNRLRLVEIVTEKEPVNEESPQ